MIPMYGQERVAHALAAEACRHEGERRKAWIDGYREILSVCMGESLERLRQATPESFLVLPETADIARTFITVPSDRKVKQQEQEIKILHDEAVEAYKKGDFQSAINQLDLLLSRFWNKDDPALRKRVTWALSIKVAALISLDRSEEAIAVFDDLIHRFGDSDAGVLVGKGAVLEYLGRKEEAITIYDDSIRHFGDSDAPALRAPIAAALVRKGFALSSLERREEAIAVWDESIRRLSGADEPALRELIAQALVGKGAVLDSLGRREEAITVYDDLIRRFCDADDPALREQVAWALNGRAWSVYAKKNNLMVDQAILDAKKAIEIDPKSVYRHTLASLFGLASRWEDAFTQARFFANDDLILRHSPDDVIEFLVYAASSGKAEEALRAIKGTKAESAMEPLVVALKMAAGNPFRAPQEVVEVAKDVLKRIEEQAKMLERKSD
jgi:tetratricopeptide (TPR) repeat protein